MFVTVQLNNAVMALSSGHCATTLSVYGMFGCVGCVFLCAHGFPAKAPIGYCLANLPLGTPQSIFLVLCACRFSDQLKRS